MLTNNIGISISGVNSILKPKTEPMPNTNNANTINSAETGRLRELERLSDVAQIDVSGGEQDYIRIQLHRDKMQQYGVSMANIKTYITTTDFTSS